MEFALIGIGIILGMVALVCAILVAVKMLQNNQTAMGVITIVGLFVCGIGYLLALIFGWQNRKAWGLEKVMPIFTASLILAFVFAGIGYGMMIPKMIDEFNKAQSELNNSEFDSGIEEPDFQDFQIESQDVQTEPENE